MPFQGFSAGWVARKVWKPPQPPKIRLDGAARRLFPPRMCSARAEAHRKDPPDSRQALNRGV